MTRVPDILPDGQWKFRCLCDTIYIPSMSPDAAEETLCYAQQMSTLYTFRLQRHAHSRRPRSSRGSRTFTMNALGRPLGRMAVVQRTVVRPVVPMTRSLATDPPKPSNDTAPPTAHTEWVQFQKSIQVDGFRTGQTLEAQTKKKRGGKRKQLDTAKAPTTGGGRFPTLRYSPEETERLLAQAYSAIPERAGKRGTRNQKRQNYRWHLVRQIRHQYKQHLAAHQERKMQERSQKVQQTLAVLHEAPAIHASDKDYQYRIYQEWVARHSPQA